MRFRIALGALMVVVLSAIAATGIASAAAGKSLTCTGGNFTGDPSTSTFTIVPSGNYSSITVAGVCHTAPGAVINVSGNINVAPGGALRRTELAVDDHGRSQHHGGRRLVARAWLSAFGRDRQVRRSAVHRRPGGQTVITVNGNITATNADSSSSEGRRSTGTSRLTEEAVSSLVDQGQHDRQEPHDQWADGRMARRAVQPRSAATQC